MLALIKERKPDLLLLSGDLFEGTQFHGRSDNEDAGLMAPTRQLYMDCILTLSSSSQRLWKLCGRSGPTTAGHGPPRQAGSSGGVSRAAWSPSPTARRSFWNQRAGSPFA
jgi:hypothetical protein